MTQANSSFVNTILISLSCSTTYTECTRKILKKRNEKLIFDLHHTHHSRSATSRKVSPRNSRHPVVHTIRNDCNALKRRPPHPAMEVTAFSANCSGHRQRPDQQSPDHVTPLLDDKQNVEARRDETQASLSICRTSQTSEA